MKNLIDYITNKNSRIIGLVKNGKVISLEKLKKVPTTKDTVSWVCARNNNHISQSTLSTLLDENRTILYCRSCAISNAKGGSFEEFKRKVEEEGYEVLSLENTYKNSKTKMLVRCNKKHEYYTTENRFSSKGSNGLMHRCGECGNENRRKHTIESVAEEFKEHGFELLATEYKNNHELMRYRCKCRRIGYISYTNFSHNIDGCKSCTRRWTYEQAADCIKEKGCELLSVIENEEEIISEFVLNATYILFICSCGTPHITTWRLFKSGARCPKCTYKKLKSTCIKIYGVDNPSKNKDIQKKITDTMFERHGVKYAMQKKEFANRAVETNKRNNKGVHNLNLKENRDKAKEICIERYGQPYFLHCKEFYDLMQKLYGAKHRTQSSFLFARGEKYKKKDYVFPSGNIASVQGYEPFALDDLLEMGYKEEDIALGADIPAIKYFFEINRYYHPDIYIPSENKLIEVKSRYTFETQKELNLLKFHASVMAGYKFEMWVYNDKKECEELVEYEEDDFE